MKQKVLELFDAGHNCAQAIVCAYGVKDGFKIAQVFGGGVAKTTEHLCGAVSGALMVVGLRYEKPEANRIAKKLLDELEKAHASLICKDILKGDGFRSTKCRDFLVEVADVLEDCLR
jgi:C_GCAxxG_C_C family probable redox protein